MCGICGIISFNRHGVDEQSIEAMMEKIEHRGPDDDGIYVSNQVGFGFLRLSILDLSRAGHQPMQDKSGRYTIVFNGEIYNYIELREQLRGKGYTFQSGTDTEVLLKAFMEWNKDCLDRLNGMFSFAIHDRQDDHIFLARDRFGIKPLYYFKDNDRFIFSSEIPSLLAVLKSENIQPNEQAIFEYLAFNRTDHTTDTFFKGIHKLQHGHYVSIKNRSFKVKKWYNLSDKLNDPFKSVDEYRDLFSSSVGLRLRSDVPVGVCLSGGLDSSSIVSTLINDYQKDDLNTFSAVYGANQRGDESEFIKLYEDQLDNMYYTTPSGDSLYDDLDDFVATHGEPVPSTGPYAQFKVMELAKNHVKVTLDGQGADEALGGYHYFFGNYFKELFYRLRFLKLANEGYHYFKQHRSLYAFKTFAFFLLPEKLKTNIRLKEKGYVSRDFAESYASDNDIAGKLYDSDNLRQSFINHFEYKMEHLLKWEDRNSMHFSLESRVPFLDHRLVERTLAMSSDQIINRGYSKHLLREAMKNTLPEKIRLRQDKVGFETPEDRWFRESKFKKLIWEIIHSKKFRERGILNVEETHSLFQKHLDGQVNISREIWKWINLELWFRKFID